MRSTKRVRFSIDIPKGMVDELLNFALWLEKEANGIYRRPDLKILWPRLANAIVDGLYEGRRKVVFTLPENEEILACFEQQLQQHSFDAIYYPEWRRLLVHSRNALASVRRPWLIQLADAING